MSAPAKERDGWDKLQILLDPFGKILTAVLVVLLGFFGNQLLQADQKRRAYVELLSRREEADGKLRTDMFSKVIEVFVGDNKAALDSQILDLELLAYNFHESIDLAPLLKQVYEQTWSNALATPKQRKRLLKVADEVVNRELGMLNASCVTQSDVNFQKLQGAGGLITNFLKVSCAKQDDLPAKEFTVDLMTNPVIHDIRRETEVDVVLKVHTPATRDAKESDQVFQFTLGRFDFPLLDNVRLGDRGRAALVMKHADDFGATVAFAYFPDSRTSLRDKPFQDEVMKTLQATD